MNTKIYILVVIALLLGILGIIFPKAIPAVINTVGGSVHNTRESFDAGIGGDLVTGNGCLDLGKEPSRSFTATELCDYGCVTLNPYDANSGTDDTGASLSLATSATMIAKCLPNVGDSKTIIFENTATASGRNFIFNTYNTAESDYELLYNAGTALYADFNDVQIVRAIHTYGATVSYQIIESTGD
jgi:hypothetical protein